MFASYKNQAATRYEKTSILLCEIKDTFQSPPEQIKKAPF
jgi:hypothetical protein